MFQLASVLYFLLFLVDIDWIVRMLAGITKSGIDFRKANLVWLAISLRVRVPLNILTFIIRNNIDTKNDCSTHLVHSYRSSVTGISRIFGPSCSEISGRQLHP